MVQMMEFIVGGVKVIGAQGIIGSLAILAGAWIVWRRIKKSYDNLKAYYQIAIVMAQAIEAIEKIDPRFPDPLVKISKQVKGMVSMLLKKEDREKLDQILKEMGYLKKTEVPT